MSTWHSLIIGFVVVLAFGGKGRISGIVGDFAQNIRSFRKGMADDEAPRLGTERRYG